MAILSHFPSKHRQYQGFKLELKVSHCIVSHLSVKVSHPLHIQYLYFAYLLKYFKQTSSTILRFSTIIMPIFCCLKALYIKMHANMRFFLLLCIYQIIDVQIYIHTYIQRLCMYRAGQQLYIYRVIYNHNQLM